MSRPAIMRMIEGAIAPAISNVFVNNAAYLCVMQITGTYSTAVVKVQGLIDTGTAEWSDLAVFDLSNLDLTESSKGNGIYQTAIEGILRVRVNVTSVTGGSISVLANFVGTAD